MILTSNNRDLITDAKYSFLNDNYASGNTSLVVENSSEFKPNDFVLFGEIGSSSAEICQISSITFASNTLVLTRNTKYSHSESSKVTVLKYDQVRFYRTATATYATTTPVLAYIVLGDETTQIDITNTAGTTYRYTYDTTGTNPDFEKHIQIGYTIITNGANFTAANNDTFVVTGVGTNYFEVTNATGVAENNKTIGTGSILVNTNYHDIDPTGFTTKVDDITNTTGFGWYTLYNSYTSTAATNSSAIPYAGFAENSVRAIIDGFYSLLNNKEQKLISSSDAFSWLNEGYSIAVNELNLTNQEYTTSSETDITIVASTQEYALEDDFSDVITVNDENGYKIEKMDVRDTEERDVYTFNDVRYYIRGAYIGFSPVPTTSATYTMRYLAKSGTLDSYYDTIDLPENNFYCMKDYMLFRAAPKLNRSDGQLFKTSFDESIQRMKLTSVKRSTDRDSWGFDEASVI